MTLDNNIENRYSFNAGYISNYQQFKKKIFGRPKHVFARQKQFLDVQNKFLDVQKILCRRRCRRRRRPKKIVGRPSSAYEL